MTYALKCGLHFSIGLILTITAILPPPDLLGMTDSVIYLRSIDAVALAPGTSGDYYSGEVTGNICEGLITFSTAPRIPLYHQKNAALHHVDLKGLHLGPYGISFKDAYKEKGKS